MNQELLANWGPFIQTAENQKTGAATPFSIFMKRYVEGKGSQARLITIRIKDVDISRSFAVSLLSEVKWPALAKQLKYKELPSDSPYRELLRATVQHSRYDLTDMVALAAKMFLILGDEDQVQIIVKAIVKEFGDDFLSESTLTANWEKQASENNLGDLVEKATGQLLKEAAKSIKTHAPQVKTWLSLATNGVGVSGKDAQGRPFSINIYISLEGYPDVKLTWAGKNHLLGGFNGEKKYRAYLLTAEDIDKMFRKYYGSV